MILLTKYISSAVKKNYFRRLKINIFFNTDFLVRDKTMKFTEYLPGRICSIIYEFFEGFLEIFFVNNVYIFFNYLKTGLCTKLIY